MWTDDVEVGKGSNVYKLLVFTNHTKSNEFRIPGPL
jgi:hypothetical protein